MDLQQLKFTVDTSELERASQAIKKLSTDLDGLKKPMKDMATQSTSGGTGGGKGGLEKQVAKNINVLEKQQSVLEYMTEGFSKGQASVLAYGKASGLAAEQLQTLGETLKSQRALQGTDPFDKSIGVLQSYTNQLAVTREVESLYSKDLGLTYKQMEELSREKIRLIEKFKIEGKALNGVNAEYEKLVNVAAKTANAKNDITRAMDKEQESTKAQTRANEFLAKETDRVNRLNEAQGKITVATNNKIIAFEKALKASGMTAAEQAKKLDAYKASMQDVQKQGGNRQVDYLSRALGPQITDIFTGLATGQNPMTVLLQQGGQLRDQFALAGVAGADMGKMLTASAKGMLVSIKDITGAVGGLFVNAVVGAGKAVSNFFTALPRAMMAIIRNTDDAAGAMDRLKVASIALGKLGIVAVVAGIATLGIEMAKISSAQSELSKSLLFTGASMGINTENAMAMGRAIGDTGKSTLKAISAISEFAKAGVIADKAAVTLAMDLEQGIGKSVEETAKELRKFKDEPNNALLELAKSTGLVTTKTLDQVKALEESGDKTKAAALATSEWQRINQQLLTEYQGSLNPISKVWLDIKKAIATAGNEIYDFANSNKAITVVTAIWKILKFAVTSVWNVIKLVINGLGTAGEMVGKIMKLDFSGAFDTWKNFWSESATQASDYGTTVANIWNEQKAEVANITQKEAERRQAASKAAGEREANAKKGEKELSAFNSLMDQAKGLYAKQKGVVDELTDSEVALNKVRSSTNWSTLTAAHQEEIELVYKKAIALDKLSAAEKERAKDMEFLASLQGKTDKMGSAYYTGLEKLLDMQFRLGWSSDELAKHLNDLYKTSNSAKAGEAINANVDKSIANINAQREALKASYGSDFLTADQKSAAAASSKHLKAIADAEADYNKNMADAKSKLADGELDKAKKRFQEEHDAKLALAKDVHDREDYLLSDSYKRQEAYSKSFEKLFNSMGDALIDFVTTGKFNFNDLIDSMLADLARYEIKQAMMSAYTGAGGASGIFKTIASIFTSATPSAKGNTFSPSGISAFANGAAFTNSIVSEPTLFKFAKGTGLMGEAGPEAIIPLKRGADGTLGVQSGGGSNVQVVVNNNSSEKATTKETTDSRGNRKIEVTIGDMTAGEIARSGSASQKSIKSTFGLQPQLIRR